MHRNAVPAPCTAVSEPIAIIRQIYYKYESSETFFFFFKHWISDILIKLDDTGYLLAFEISQLTPFSLFPSS